ncbi:MAG: EAL domain-containing protein [Alicyclobacillus sp.]|nr:EAL domain-containing protein [Alicyclobacillus sp.]
MIAELQSLDVVYQPLVNHHTGQLFGYEGLSRPSVNGEAIPPDVWFSEALVRGEHVQADLWAIGRMVEEFAAYGMQSSRQRRGPSATPFSSNHPKDSAVPLFVNVMPHSLQDERFLERLMDLLTRTQFPPTQLVLEIVEATGYDLMAVSRTVHDMRSLGFRFALDDVGVGGASLHALVELGPEFVKLDRVLVQNAAHAPRKQRLLAALQQFVEDHQQIIAEGLENAEDLAAVRAAGIHLSQGYHWSHPQPLRTFLEGWAPFR